MKFTHLHCHSHYSLLDGLPKIDDFLDYVKELGMDSVALTDHGNLYGAVEFYEKAKKREIKPIIGIELYMALEKMSQKRPNIDNKNYHLLLLVKNEAGYKNLVKLVTKAHLEGFYYKPRVDEDLLKRHHEGLIMLSGCLQGKIPRKIIAGKIKEAEDLALQYQDIFGKDSFYLELQHHPNLPEQKKVNETLIRLSKKLKIPLVATNDCHYLRPEDAEAQDILMLINTGARPDDPERITMKTDDFSVREPERMIKDFKTVPEAIENTQKIVSLCNFEFKLGKIKLPYFAVPNGKTADEYLRDLCLAGIEKRHLKKTKELLDRLDYELGVIKQTGFASYFLIVADFANWAKEHEIVVGPGRGSVTGSVVAYLMGITDVNPLNYGLLFERFLNPSRISMPDIDLDFADTKRDKVINYVRQKYGEDKVAQIITFGTMAARAVVRDVGRALGYPYLYCDKIAKLIPFNFTLDDALSKIDEFRSIYESDEKAQKLIDFAKKLEGCARHVSTHACGVVISKDPLEDTIPLQHPTQNDDTIVTQYEMHSIEDLGFLKMDFLGLKNLTIIENTIKLIKKLRGQDVDIENIPLDDKKTYKLLQKAETIGVFQLESSGMRGYLKQLKPSKFEDLVAMVALYRPGPMQFIPEYIARKEKRKKIEYIHPKLKPVLESTYGLPIFQEQLMQIAQVIAGFSLNEADVLRKAVGKKISSLLYKQKEKFMTGAEKQGIKKEIADKIWSWFLPFARYGFNKSHSVGYGMIAYQTAYLKAHFPVEFMASLLKSEKNDVERVGFLITECKRMGIEVLPPDINESLDDFTVVPGQNKIRFGMLAIKNVGHDIVEAIIRERKSGGPYKDITDFVNRIDSKNLNKRSLESLIKSGVFDKLEERNRLLSNLERLLEWSRDSQKQKINGQKGLFDSFGFNNKLHLAEAKPASKADKLKWEKELLGLFVTSHPLEDFRDALAKKSVPISDINTTLINRRVTIGGVISKIKKIITKSGKPMLFLGVEDLTGRTEVVCFPRIVEENPLVFQENKVVLISGRVDNRNDSPKIICETIEELICEN